MTKDRTTLSVKDSMSDSGRYFLTLENTAGVKTFTITVVVIEARSRNQAPLKSSISSESCVLSWAEPQDNGGTDIYHC